ncbi:MAG: hypothetical protein IJ882_01125 [Paludibacteraceae bacterium]|nr:hypothetical protein [Paludibacteraceae bacterium]
MRRLLWIIVLVMAMASAYAQVPQDSLEVRNDTLRVLVADSAGAFMVTDTIVEVEQPAVKEDTIQEKGNVLTGKYERLKDGTRIYSDSVIYQGMNIKLDLATTILEAAMSKGNILSFEAAWNVRLKQRYYPTLEGGYVRANASADGGRQKGVGGFFRVGLDINGLKKHPERLNAAMVGIRVGTGLQSYDLTGVTMNDNYWSGGKRLDFVNQFHADCWGEVVAGCQVQVWEGFQMGWYVRLKILFTRKAKDGEVLPYYIPGFGYRDDTNWGINYYIGYKF